MRLIIRCLMLALLAVGLVGTSAGAGTTPAGLAGPCEDFDLRDTGQVRAKVDDADTVFEGRVMRSRQRVRASGNDYAHVVEVQVVYAGDVMPRDRVTVITKRPAEDGLGRLRKGDRFVFFTVRQASAQFLATRCGGTTELRRGGLPRSARAALDEALKDKAADSRTATVALREPAGGTESPPSLARSAAPGLAVVLLGVLGLLLVLALGSRRP